MAESFVRDAESELTCPVCLELFILPNTPKNFSECAHVCCELCLTRMVRGKKRTIKCPECQIQIKIPKGGVTELKTNHKLQNLAEKHDKTTAKSTRESAKPDLPTCTTHKGEVLYFICVQCNVLACNVCLKLQHTGARHKCEGVKEKYNERKTNMESTITQTNEKISQAKAAIQQLKMLEADITDNENLVKKQIDKCTESHVRKINEQSRVLKTKVEGFGQEMLDKIRQEMLKVEKDIRIAEAGCSTATTSLNQLPKYDYVIQHNDLIDNMEKLGIVDYVPGLEKSESLPKFSANSESKFTLGRIITPTKPRHLEKQPTLIYEPRWLRTIASSSQLLAVCDSNGHKVTIYRKVDGKYDERFTLDLPSSKIYPMDVCICPHGRFLVARGRGVEVYTPEGAFQKIISTDSASDSGKDATVCSVKITSDGQIIAGDISRSVITVHNPAGSVIRAIATRIKPCFITLIQDKQLAMSDFETGKVIVMQIESGLETLSIDIPQVEGICYDEQTDCLLTVSSKPTADPRAVRPKTGVIQQYCASSGKLIKTLAEGLYRPLGMTFTSEGLLAVVDQKQVKFYSIM